MAGDTAQGAARAVAFTSARFTMRGAGCHKGPCLSSWQHAVLRPFGRAATHCGQQHEKEKLGPPLSTGGRADGALLLCRVGPHGSLTCFGTTQREQQGRPMFARVGRTELFCIAQGDINSGHHSSANSLAVRLSIGDLFR